MKKEYVTDLVVLNFYRFKLYKITDAVGNVIFNAEPVGEGVTRVGSREEIQAQLVKDCKFMNWLHKRDSQRVR